MKYVLVFLYSLCVLSNDILYFTTNRIRYLFRFIQPEII